MPTSKKYLQLEDISSYRLAYELGQKVWDLVIKWDWFEKRTIGSQFVRAIDSISANIAEGFGRHTKKDKIRFYIIAKGSVYESQDWLSKARDRSLIEEKEIESLEDQLKRLPKEINALIKYTNQKLTI